MSLARCSVCVIVGVLALSGCDTSESLYSATGTVTHSGAPVEGATVSFVPEKEGKGGFGVTDAGGKFTLQTDGKPGIRLGAYKVTVTKRAKIGGMPAMPTPEDMKNMAAKGGAMVGKSEIPEKYARVDSSGLSATVTPDAAKNSFPLDLQ